MLSHITGITMVNDCSSYGAWQVLIVDDICDSGKTLQEYKEYTTAVLHHKPHTSCFTPTIYANLHEGDEWVIYPWERDDSKSIQDYKYGCRNLKIDYVQLFTDQPLDIALNEYLNKRQKLK